MPRLKAGSVAAGGGRDDFIDEFELEGRCRIPLRLSCVISNSSPAQLKTGGKASQKSSLPLSAPSILDSADNTPGIHSFSPTCHTLSGKFGQPAVLSPRANSACGLSAISTRMRASDSEAMLECKAEPEWGKRHFAVCGSGVSRLYEADGFLCHEMEVEECER